jgi:hypothetical protein
MSQNVIGEPDGADGNNEAINNIDGIQCTETPCYQKSKSQDNRIKIITYGKINNRNT